MPKAPIPDIWEGRRVVTAAQMAELDRRAAEEFHMPTLELMERAGRGVAERARAWLCAKTGKPPERLTVTACCGRGNNGGDGLVAARHLRAGGASVHAFLIPPRTEGGYPEEVQRNLRRALESGVNVLQLAEDATELDRCLAASDGALDALLGTGSSGKPAGLIRLAIQRMMRSAKPLIAVDIPSGLQPDTGHHSGVFVCAALTVALGLPKRGLLAAHAQKNVGELCVVDLGYPPQLL
ncbi:MAG: NAD(P)H-hydrate epimerase [Elusimicrobia bacterium]|nr:NAD(P)H-hydrate epimerase [Elusimicrobiota bacterium]